MDFAAGLLRDIFAAGRFKFIIIQQRISLQTPPSLLISLAAKSPGIENLKSLEEMRIIEIIGNN